MANILIIEDDKRICKIVEDYLIKDGHDCFITNNGLDIINMLKKSNPDLIILDLMLPELDGFTICKLIRTVSEVPIIILTAKTEEVDKLMGYELGADDYVTKPFSPRVLNAKVKVLLKRSEIGFKEDIIINGNISIDNSSLLVYVDGE
ncbi:MAG: response regulator transcription factor [Miniphocaeibacter sp.]|uniref:response regulator transcription factor n=1 Tax=Miniphocaeibacter sp. TaxID=3100973 RepID=UPI003BB192FF